MIHTVYCVIFKEELEGLGFKPVSVDLRARILDNVSNKAWQQWLTHQTMLINEYRLTPIEQKDRNFLEQEMEKFFFGEGSARPEEFIDPE